MNEFLEFLKSLSTKMEASILVLQREFDSQRPYEGSDYLIQLRKIQIRKHLVQRELASEYNAGKKKLETLRQEFPDNDVAYRLESRLTETFELFADRLRRLH